MDMRLFVKKKEAYQTEARTLEKELRDAFHLKEDFSLQLYNIYDLYNITEKEKEILSSEILADPITDELFEQAELFETEKEKEGEEKILAWEYLPGQYDQRADSALQCLALLAPDQKARIHSGTLLKLFHISDENVKKVEQYLINPVEARRKDLSILDDFLDIEFEPVKVINGFREMDQKALQTLHEAFGLAMSLQDLAFIQSYFQKEGREPTETEIRVLDTYWSDHCRHTTFETHLENVDFSENDKAKEITKTWNEYLDLRKEIGREEKPKTLMDVATIAARVLRERGILDNQEESEENNACSIVIDVDVNGEEERWLLQFKNETHNHPTEIEPFGGASTCLGGAIRDPLSGRSYVFQAMRITGAGDINASLEKTLPHKLPQSKISKEAAAGYSSYGNQIGLPTTFVQEIFDEDYQAKRMEVGVVVGAVKEKDVTRQRPKPGDLILLAGGATGRDGIGGATGSSKEHTETSLEKCSSEVQKGNALIERKLQRFFKNPEVSKKIKKANDFGAGGVSVAIGELADGLLIDLDVVPIKYEGLDGTELAISESQERMALCIAPEDLDFFQKEAQKENLAIIPVAKVTDSNRLQMDWKGERIVDIDRDFLNTNGVSQKTNAISSKKTSGENPFLADRRSLCDKLSSYNSASQIGLAEMFDASIGKSTVLMPFGGKYQDTPEQGSVQKLPVKGLTNTCSVLAFGFDPLLMKYNPYIGAQYSVVEALSKLAALGADPLRARLSNQEYFQKLHNENDFALPLEALLGLLKAQMAFETPSIGGKDSMSGTFKEMHVPPTLITFAITTAKQQAIKSSVLKNPGDKLYLLETKPVEQEPDYKEIKKLYRSLLEHNKEIVSSRAVLKEGLSVTLAKMAFGNRLGVKVKYEDLDAFLLGSIVVEARLETDQVPEGWVEIGEVTAEPVLDFNGEKTEITEALKAWKSTFSRIYPEITPGSKPEDKNRTIVPSFIDKKEKVYSRVKVEKPLVLIPVFPGTNCELDLREKFERAGAKTEILVFNNQSPELSEASIDKLAKALERAQILMLAGGFSLADEPDGSGKFIASVLKNEKIARAIENFRQEDGLILGICNGFQALLKSGLLLGNEVKEGEPTLFKNDLNRHISHVVQTAITNANSPWLQDFVPGQIHSIAISHGEGKVVADEKWLEKLAKNGQIATQYVDESGLPTMNPAFNVNGSMAAIEGILSEDGRILGKMGHSERYEPGLFINIEGDKDQDLFASGVHFFTHQDRKESHES